VDDAQLRHRRQRDALPFARRPRGGAQPAQPPAYGQRGAGRDANPTNASEGGQRVYADIAGRFLLSLPILFAGILLAGLVAGLGFVTWRARAFWRPLLITAGMIVAGVAAAFALVFVAGFVRAGDYWRAWPLISYLATYATLLAAMLAVLAWLGRRVSRDKLRIAAWLLIALLGGSEISFTIRAQTRTVGDWFEVSSSSITLFVLKV
jgi:hypothetical protein